MDCIIKICTQNIELTWFLLIDKDFVGIEQMINNNFSHVNGNYYFQNLKGLFGIVYVPNLLNTQSRLDKASKSVFSLEAVTMPYKNGYLSISILHNKTI